MTRLESNEAVMDSHRIDSHKQFLKRTKLEYVFSLTFSFKNNKNFPF